MLKHGAPRKEVKLPEATFLLQNHPPPPSQNQLKAHFQGHYEGSFI